MNKIQKIQTHLSAPLAFQASLGGDPAVAAVHQGLQALDLEITIDIDFEVEVVSVATTGPGEISAVGKGQDALAMRFAEEILRSGGAGEELAVEDAGEEEGCHHQNESSDVVGAGTQKLVLILQRSNSVASACGSHLGNQKWDAFLLSPITLFPPMLSLLSTSKTTITELSFLSNPNLKKKKLFCFLHFFYLKLIINFTNFILLNFCNTHP